MMNNGWGGGYGGMSTGGGILMMVFWLAIIVGIVLLIVWLVRQTSGAPSGYAHWDRSSYGPSAGGSALDILKERYAKGEIDKAEFEEKKKDLTS
jgi:putative membrane protein